MKCNYPNKEVKNRRCYKKRNNNFKKVRDLVNAVRRNVQGKASRKSNSFNNTTWENIFLGIVKKMNLFFVFSYRRFILSI